MLDWWPEEPEADERAVEVQEPAQEIGSALVADTEATVSHS